MTSEIAIYNKNGIVLAADSAVTIGGKIYSSANKIFQLSKEHPIGIMLYNSSRLMDTPWEVIIKVYRDELGQKKFNHLSEYAEDFIVFLNKKNEFISEDTQESVFYENLKGYFKSFFREEYTQSGTTTPEEENRFLKKVIDEKYIGMKNSESISPCPNKFVDEIMVKYKKITFVIG